MAHSKVYNNGAWESANLKVYNNGAWETANAKVYNNGAWESLGGGKVAGYDMTNFFAGTLTYHQSVGINVHFETLPTDGTWNGDYSCATNRPYTDAIGAKIIRLFINYYDCNTSYWDGIVSSIINAGQIPLFALTAYVAPGSTSISPPNTAAIRTTWSNWAASWVRHYVSAHPSSPMIFEIWNEPNAPAAWGGTPSGTDYVALCSEAVTAMRAQCSNRICIIAPCCAMDVINENTYQQIDRTWFSACVSAGLLSIDLDAISIHGYYNAIPEQCYDDYDNYLRPMTSLPIVQTEQGYYRNHPQPYGLASAWSVSTEEAQGWLAQRIMLFNMWKNIRMTCYYVLNDDFGGNGDAGTYGLMSSSQVGHRAYAYMQELQTRLGSAYVTSTYHPNSNDFVMYFSNGVVAYWTVTTTVHNTTIPINGTNTTFQFAPWVRWTTYTV